MKVMNSSDLKNSLKKYSVKLILRTEPNKIVLATIEICVSNLAFGPLLGSLKNEGNKRKICRKRKHA